MIGKIYTSRLPFYDIKQHKMSVKARPVLIISEERNNDHTVLPVSSVTNRKNLDKDFDVEISPSQYPLLNINHTSYVRTHKQTTVHIASLGKEISNLKDVYPDLFLEILSKREQWNKLIDEEALN